MLSLRVHFHGIRPGHTQRRSLPEQIVNADASDVLAMTRSLAFRDPDVLEVGILCFDRFLLES
jgi:hypothetical protein